MKTSFIKYSLAPLMLSALLAGCQAHDTIHATSIATAKDSVDDTTVVPTNQMLAQYDWQLIRTEDKEVVPFLANTILDFKGNQLAFSVGCNRHLGEFTLSDGLLSLDKTSLIATRKSCESSLHQAENALITSLESAKLNFISTDKQATQATLAISSRGKSSLWQGKRKPDLLYGESVILYWEIDAKPVVCANNTQECLKVRNIRYDNYGVKIGAGAWRYFDGKIEGYKHDLSLSQIIRLKAYGNTATHDTPVYIYDGVVESSLVE
ncbi:META domain-containing protein [Moraxella haemolytica]|uniref:META domain-containing protein n=1 Tax=Moraxella haemolytica TaxID=2904119 RepID=UPI0025439CDA|nr:META domain-containing protein [Moraxella sp. ZY171148]WII96035.1 META domain-containing protein [Moraxella sp. ZY171148]